MTPPIKLEVGKTYKLNNGEVHKCRKMRGNDPLDVSIHGYGPFVIDGLCYHRDGRFGKFGFDYGISVKCCIDDDHKRWRDMTPEEKGALLLAHHEGKVIEYFSTVCEGVWESVICHEWCSGIAYRVRPEPIRETITFHPMAGHAVTYETIDGKPDWTTLRGESK